MDSVKVEVGQTVMVLDGHGRARMNPVRGTVIKVARVWIDVHREGSNWGWRFRRDTRTDGSTFGSPARFYTLDQWAERERKMSASAYLREQGVSINTGSLWRDREVELATLIGWTDTSQTVEPDNQEG